MSTPAASRPSPEHARGLVWFRRDLRTSDHAALYHALRSCREVWCCFVFDTDILKPLIDRGLLADRRVEFIHRSVVELDAGLRSLAGGRESPLIVEHGRAREIVPALARALAVDVVHANTDYELDAVERDAAVATALEADDRSLSLHKDQVIFEKDEIVTKGGTFFAVFTPYKSAWMKTVTPFFVSAYPVERHAAHLAVVPAEHRRAIPSLDDMGFEPTNFEAIDIPAGMSGAHDLVDAFEAHIDDYHDARNYPAARGTSYLSVHLRFGTISVRALARSALDRAHRGPARGAKGAETWLSELIWRDFYFQVLHHRPELARGASFKPKFDRVAWLSGDDVARRFDAWCAGATGYPLIDAAMTQINLTGFMHNRLRMVTASFLSKHLGVDWRLGERYFADLLNDYDLAANNGGWQWAASCGCDAQPWFRIFNPILQSKRFDPDGAFIRRYLPGLSKLSNRDIHTPWLASAATLERAGIVLGRDYPEPIVEHETARREALARYGAVRGPATDNPP